jgi:hypothetical protein
MGFPGRWASQLSPTPQTLSGQTGAATRWPGVSVRYLSSAPTHPQRRRQQELRQQEQEEELRQQEQEGLTQQQQEGLTQQQQQQEGLTRQRVVVSVRGSPSRSSTVLSTVATTPPTLRWSKSERRAAALALRTQLRTPSSSLCYRSDAELRRGLNCLH